jgi:macrolide transport system ATP-binding/permease protein
MRLLSMIRLRFRSLLARDTVEQELDEELQYHFDRQVAKYRAAGMSTEDAPRQALREMWRLRKERRSAVTCVG